MHNDLEVVELGPTGFQDLPCCGIKNPEHPGRIRKECWMKAAFTKGLRAKVLLDSGRRQCGYIEYMPGEYAWRGVDAAGFLFIHCVWISSRKHQRAGIASAMVAEVLRDARNSGMKGVAVMTREGPWLAGSALFVKNGFALVDTAPPDYQLLVKKLDKQAADPKFRGGWEKKLHKYSRGLTIMRSDQCPQAVKFADEIAEAARQEYGLEPRMVELKTHRQAQEAPTPYAVFSVILEGKVLADHPISLTRFRNIMRTQRV